MEADRHSPGILKKLQPALGRIGKYKYALIVLLAGVFLMLLPSRQERTPASEPSAGAPASEVSEMQDALAKLLSKIDGAGRVEVLLSLEYGAESYYQSDENTSASGDTESREQTIVLYQPDSTQRLPAVSAAAAWLRRCGHSLRVRAPRMVSMAFPPFDGIIVSRRVKKDKQKQGDEQASPCRQS